MQKTALPIYPDNSAWEDQSRHKHRRCCNRPRQSKSTAKPLYNSLRRPGINVKCKHMVRNEIQQYRAAIFQQLASVPAADQHQHRQKKILSRTAPCCPKYPDRDYERKRHQYPLPQPGKCFIASNPQIMKHITSHKINCEVANITQAQPCSARLYKMQKKCNRQQRRRSCPPPPNFPIYWNLLS